MGWNIKLKSKKEITPQDAEKAVNALPKSLLGSFSSKQLWGWSIAVDVYNPKGKVLEIHASYGMSGKIAEPAAEALSRQLEKLGHEITVGEMS
jgi:hypothetical protein